MKWQMICSSKYIVAEEMPPEQLITLELTKAFAGG